MSRSSVLLLLFALSGCEPLSSLHPKRPEAGEKPDPGESSITRVAAPPAADVVASDPPFQELIPLIDKESPQDTPRTDPQTWYGVWVSDRTYTRTWMRIERPLIHMVGIDKKTNASWVMDGHYAVAANGMMYGVMTALDAAGADEERARALLENDERVLHGRRSEKKMMPFSCQLHADGPQLDLTDFHGTCFHKEREHVIHGRYERSSLGRPSVAVPGAPLGTWENDTMALRVTLIMQPGRFEFRLFDRRSGLRTHLAGNYDAGPDGIIFGVITSVEHGEIGKTMTRGHIPPQVICFRYGFRSSLMVIDDVRSLGLARKSEETLVGEYRPPNAQGQTGQRRRGRS